MDGAQSGPTFELDTEPASIVVVNLYLSEILLFFQSGKIPLAAGIIKIRVLPEESYKCKKNSGAYNTGSYIHDPPIYITI